MKRGEPPKRRTPLKRTALKRGPGRKARREAADLATFKEAVHLRWWCEAAGKDWDGEPICGRRDRHVGTQAHHVWPEDRDRGVHDPGRGMLLCAWAHRWAHDHPEAAADLGILRPLAD